MKKFSLVSLEKEELKKTQMKSIKGGGVCACRHQDVRRSNGIGRSEVKSMIAYFV